MYAHLVSSLFKYLFSLCLQRLCLLEIKVPKKAKSKPMQLTELMNTYRLQTPNKLIYYNIN